MNVGHAQVMTDAIRQFFNQFKQRQQPFLKAFWRRSLVGANFAHVLANLTGYRAPDEAYLCGLLTDVGQMVLLNRHGQRYLDCWNSAADDRALLAAERDLFGSSHADIGAQLVEHWAGASFMADSTRMYPNGPSTPTVSTGTRNRRASAMRPARSRKASGVSTATRSRLPEKSTMKGEISSVLTAQPSLMV